MKTLHISAKSTAADKTVQTAEKTLTVSSNTTIDLGDEYPFCKNVYVTGDSGFSLRQIKIDSDTVWYAGDIYHINGGEPLEIRKIIGDETIDIRICIK